MINCILKLGFNYVPGSSARLSMRRFVASLSSKPLKLYICIFGNTCRGFKDLADALDRRLPNVSASSEFNIRINFVSL